MGKSKFIGHASPSAEAKGPTTSGMIPTPEHKPTHRYFCDACTGIAGVSNIPEAVKQITCKVCGKTQICKKENWLKL